MGTRRKRNKEKIKRPKREKKKKKEKQKGRKIKIHREKKCLISLWITGTGIKLCSVNKHLCKSS